MKKAILCFLILMVSIIVAITLVKFLDNKKQTERVALVAIQLGYKPENKIDIYNKSWDIFEHQGIYLHFSSDLTQEGIGELINKFDMEKVNEMDIDGYEIFTNINLSPLNNKLTVNGNDMMGVNRAVFLQYKGYKWKLLDNEGKNWTISHYDIRTTKQQFEFNGKPINAAIVEIMLQTK